MSTMKDLKTIFRELYNEWFDNKQFWFDKKEEYDIYLSDKYFYHIKDISGYNDELVSDDSEVQIGAILALDQIPRHYNRVYNGVDCHTYSRVAADIALGLMGMLSTNIYAYDNISAYEWCFIMIPFRHINDIGKLNTIVRFMIEKHNNENTTQKDKAIYKKYLLKTLNSVYKVNTQRTIDKQKHIHRTYQNTIGQWGKYGEVLHNAPYAIMNVLCDDFDGIYNKMQNETRDITNENIILSLSGGVDSCVCLYLLKQLLPNNNIIAVHINYDNRPDENIQELKFVSKFCGILNIKLFYRTIHEIRRDDCHMHGMRDLYESITKDIRYDTYQQVAKMFENDKKVLVVLGHNMDDCFENIITNISNKSNYENLSGVSKISVVSGINFWRPMIDIRKHEIVDFAIHNHIPFLKNSTPTWSARGKIRDVVYPALQNINQDVMNSFFVLKEYLQSYHELVDKYVLKDIINAFEYDSNEEELKGWFDIDKLICMFSIWKQVFDSDRFKSMLGTKKISNKSITEYAKCLERFKENPKRKIKYILRHDVQVIIEHEGDTNKVLITFFLV